MERCEYIVTCDQGSDEWHRLRTGSVGGSSLNFVLAKGEGKSRKTLLYQLAAEILSGNPTNGHVSAAMERGTELEPEARQCYEFMTGCNVEQVALVKSWMPRVHVSPDGLIGDDGGLEIKVMLPHTYIELVDTGKIDLRYIRQVNHFLWITGREWCDIAAYCPEIQVRPMWIKRIFPDPEIFEAIEVELPAFFEELQALIDRISA